MIQTEEGGEAELFDGRTVLILSREVLAPTLETMESGPVFDEIVSHFGALSAGETRLVLGYLKPKCGPKVRVVENWNGDEHLKVERLSVEDGCVLSILDELYDIAEAVTC
jgi:hypothetical protein